MSIETELKYKVNKLPNKYDKKISIIQTYFDGFKKEDILHKIFPEIDIDNISTFRTRQIKVNDNIEYILTLKTKSNDGYSRFEYEKNIDIDTYKSLITDNELSIVIKNRYVLKYNNYKFEFDEYLNTKEYLITCEVELDNNDLDSIEKEKENIEKILEEFGLEYIDVTMDYRYKNSNITKYF